MFVETTDEEVFKRFWRDEKDNAPRHIQDASDVWHTSWDEFRVFCENCEVYLINNAALVYVEPTGNIHFSLIRGSKIDFISDLIELRDELFKRFEILFGWAGTHSRGLKRILEAVGFEYEGFSMIHGESHGRSLEWHCYIVRKRYIAKDNKNLLQSV